MKFLEIKYSDCTDEDLMGYISSGKTPAFEELYQRYKRNLHYFFYRMLNKDAAIADDFLQELFLKVIEKPHLFDRKKKFSTWIYTVAVNMCKNEYRRQNIRYENALDETFITDFLVEDEIYSIQFDNILFTNRLTEELDLLEENQKVTFVLRYQEELSIKEIAEIMNCSQGTVKSRIFYTLKKLSEKLKIFNPQTI